MLTNCNVWFGFNRLGGILLVIVGISLQTMSQRLDNRRITVQQVRDSISNCLVFKSSDVFYAKGELNSKNAKYLELSSKDKQHLQSDLNRVVETIAIVYAKHIGKLSAYFEKPLQPKLPPTVLKIVDEGSSKIGVEPFEDKRGSEEVHINIDVKVLRDSLIAGLVAAYRGSESLNPVSASNRLFFLGEKPGTLTDEQIVASFLIFKRGVKTSLSNNSLNDAQVNLLAAEVQTLDSRYSGVLLFVIAHELGHFVLQHSSDQDYPGCVRFQSEEFEADKFASFLLGYTFSYRRTFSLALFDDKLETFFNYVGARVFFQEGCERFRCKNPDQVGQVCAHPAAQDRLAEADDAIKDAFIQSKEDQDNEAIDALDKRIKAIDDKNRKRNRP